MITHIGLDSQFMQFVSSVFESVAPGANEYIIYAKSHHAPLRFPIQHGRVRVVSSGPSGVAPVPFSVRKSSMVIAHSMSLHAAIGFLFSRPATTRVWSGWGADYYGDDVSSDSGLLGPSTRKLAEPSRDRMNRIVASVKSRIRGTLLRLAAAKTDYFSAPIPDDFEVFKKRFPKFRGGYSQVNYVSVADSFALRAELTGESDILVGNSCTYANNHLEVFDLLAGLDLTGRKIVVPLSYGGDAPYRAAVLARGSELFGSAFTPLVDLLPLDEYAALIANCGVVVMGHKRQQALGNIGVALYHGAHVYLDPQSPSFAFFRSRSAVIHPIERLAVDGLPSTRLAPEMVATNRRVLEEFWGTEKVVKNVVALAGLRGVKPR